MDYLVLKAVVLCIIAFSAGVLFGDRHKDSQLRSLSIEAFAGLHQTFLVSKIIQFQRLYGVWVDFNCIAAPTYEGVIVWEDRTTRIQGDSLLQVMQMTQKVLEGDRDVRSV